MGLKEAAFRVESRIGDVKYRTTSSPAKYLSDQEYINMRAFNQAYMEALGETSVVLYRGTGGKTGASMKASLLAETTKKMHRTQWEITDSALAGYSLNYKTARQFGKNGIWVKSSVPINEIFIHKNLLSGLTTNHLDEEEFILIRGPKSVNLADVYWSEKE